MNFNLELTAEIIDNGVMVTDLATGSKTSRKKATEVCDDVKNHVLNALSVEPAEPGMKYSITVEVKKQRVPKPKSARH